MQFYEFIHLQQSKFRVLYMGGAATDLKGNSPNYIILVCQLNW